ncbi:MAG: uracil-DNA glycosylase [Chthoniobacteraceae bacterium]
MNEFQEALDFTTESLRKLHETGSNPRGSRESLHRLASARPKPAPAPKPVQPGASPEAPIADAIPPDVFPTTGANKGERIEQLRAAVAPCAKCPSLARTRTQTVFGVGDIDARIMFVGEAPGADEDQQGEPFVGKAGQLLTRIIETMGVKRSDVFIANVLKCRPDMPPGSTGNRRPTTTEMRTCLPYLRAQIEIIQPAVLVALGSVAMEGLLGAVEPMARLRGRWHEFQGIPLMATYHPAYLLRNQSLTEKRKVWEDMLLVMERVGLPISEKQRGYFLK